MRFDGKRLFATGAGSGLAAIVAQPGNPYGAVKGATLAFSRQLAADLAERGGGSYERGAPLSGEERA